MYYKNDNRRSNFKEYNAAIRPYQDPHNPKGDE